MNDIFQLKKLDIDAISLEDYAMYQEIAPHEPGAENLASNLNFNQFKKYVKTQIERENYILDNNDTPTATYIMYVNNFPVGDICIRTKLNKFWENHSGNIYYKIRPSERRKGYATKMLELALKECRKMGYSEVLLQSSENNIASAKTIENNGGILIREQKSRFYKIIIS